MSNGERTPPIKPQESVDSRLAALLVLQDMQAALERLAKQADSLRVHDAINHVGREVTSKVYELTHQPSPREIALMRWAKVRSISGANTYVVQGRIISMSIPWMSDFAESLLSRMVGTSLSLNDVKDAGYRAVKSCVWVFDPSQHGDSFQEYAWPFVYAAVQHCLATGQMEFAETIPMEYLRQLCEQYSLPVQPEPVSPSPVVAPESQVIATPPAPVRDDPKPIQTDLPAKPREPDPPPAIEDSKLQKPEPLKLDPEQEANRKQQRRFCRWAKDDLQIDVTQDQFDHAVQLVAEKFHPLAKNTVDRVDVPSSFRGGKSAVRREAVRLLPQRVQEFDPAGGEHINQFLVVWLEAKLNEFVKGNGKKKRET